MTLSIEVDERPSAWVYELDGDLDYAECASFRSKLDRAMKDGPSAVIVDLSHLDYLDSSGLGLLLSTSKDLAARGAKLVIVTNETVDNILTLTRLSGIFSTAANLADAEAMAAS